MHVHVNAATSLGSKLSSRRREQVTISGDNDFARVDEIRATADAVAVGVGTVPVDDPHLTLDGPGLVTARGDRGDSPHPARVVADPRARTPTDTRILGDAATTYLLVSKAALGSRREALETAGAELIVAGAGRVSLPDAFDVLEAHGVDRLMVEGSGELIFSLSGASLVDEFTLYASPLVIGGRGAPTLADDDGFVSGFPRLSFRDVERVDDGVLLTYDC